MSEQVLEPLKKQLEEINDQITAKPLTLEEFNTLIVKADKIRKKLLPYLCPLCFKLIYDREEFVIENQRRWHKSCIEERERVKREYQKFREEMNKRSKQIAYERERSIRPAYWNIYFPVKGLKKDFDRFMDDLSEIVKKYNLTPPKIIRDRKGNVKEYRFEK